VSVRSKPGKTPVGASDPVEEGRPLTGRALEGMRVVDLAEERGELCGRLLADLGADVIRVEPPGGASSRRLPPFDPHTGASLYFAVRNFNKRGATLDLAEPLGRSAFLELLDDADVMLESFEPGALARLGLAPAELLERYPQLVITSVTDFGQTGPYRDYVGSDPTLVALGGMLFRSGLPLPHPPLLPPGAMAYDIAGVTAAFATLVAYWQRLRTGSGQHVDVSVMESAHNNSDWSMPNASLAGFDSYLTIRAGSGAAYPIYPCRDGYVRLIILSPRQWHALRSWLGDPEWLMDPKWDQPRLRSTINDVLGPMIVELFSGWDKEALAREAQGRGLALTPVLTPGEVLASEHFQARGTFRSVEVCPGVTGPVAQSLIEIDGQRQGYRFRAPGPGEENHRWLVESALKAESSHPGVNESSTAEPAPQPLAGLRVLDFGIGGVGVETGRLLAEYGADVIKIESKTYPDFMRTIQGTLMNASFASSSRSKRGFGVNLSLERGKQILHDLVRTADVIVENSATGVMQRLGAGYETVREINPRIVMMSSQLMGPDGPWSGWIGYGPSTRPVGGLTYLWNYDDSPAPAGSGAIYPDHLVGRVGAFGALAALIGRERSGRGAHVEVPQVETTVGLLADLFLAEALAPGSVKPLGNRSLRGAPWGVYQCSGEEQWCVVTVRSDDEWNGLRLALGAPAWAADPSYTSTAGRMAAQSEIDAQLTKWTRQRTPRQVMELLQSHRVPAGMMQYPTDTAHDPQLLHRTYLRSVDQPELGTITLEGPAFRGTGLPEPIVSKAPRLGEHSREISEELLGMSPSEVTQLMADGILEESR